MIIKRARLNELTEIRNFYNMYWGEKHPLVNVKAFIDFYFVDGENLNFIIARETNDSEIISACGYILSNTTANPDAWSTLWLTKKGAGSNIGLQIVNYMATQMGFRLLATNNARQNTLLFYEFLGYQTAKMEHYYRLSDRNSYRVAVVRHREFLPCKTTEYSLKIFKNPQELLYNFDDSVSRNNKPYKDLNYIVKRYYYFPFYSYLVYGIMDAQKNCRSVIVLRLVKVNCTSVLRIVDLIGQYDELAEIGYCLQDLMRKFNCEYIDFYCYGLVPEILSQAGFTKRNENDGNIIPNYLEPYAAINTDYYLFCNKMDDFVLFKADGDQDRLNIELM